MDIEEWWKNMEEKYGGKSAMELARWYIALRKRHKLRSFKRCRVGR